MLSKGLEEVKKSVISFCETIIRDSEDPPDLTSLRSHTTYLPVSLESFDEDIVKGIRATSYNRYKRWYNTLYRGVKRPREVKSTAAVGEGSKKSRQA